MSYDFKTQYVASIFYEINDIDLTEEIHAKAWDMFYTASDGDDDFEFEDSEGGPAHGPYFVITGNEESKVRELANEIVHLIKKYPGHEFL